MLTNHRTWKPINCVNQECGQNESKAGFDMLGFKNSNEFVVHRPACAKLLLEELVLFAHPQAGEGPVSQPCSDPICPFGTVSPFQLCCTCAFLTMLYSARLPYPISLCSYLIRLPHNALFLHSEITN